MEKLFHILLVILISSVKFLAGPPFAFYSKTYNFNFLETISYCIIGGMLGVYVFNFFAKPIMQGINSLFNLLWPGRRQRKKQIFSSRNRRLVRFYKSYGLAGVAILTPIFLSIPIGNIIAAKIEHNKKKIFLYMFLSISFWALAFTGTFEILHANSLQEIRTRFFNFFGL